MSDPIINHLQDTIATLSARNHLLCRELDAYRLKVFGAIGGAINCDNFDLIIVCKTCGSPASPIDHVCAEFS